MSQFDSLFKTNTKTKADAVKPKTESRKKKADASPSPTAKPAAPVKEQKRPGGKSSNPDYAQALAYVRKTTLKSVKRELLDEPDLDFSELVESLLTDWLKSKK